jgi:hypothetical protein
MARSRIAQIASLTVCAVLSHFSHRRLTAMIRLLAALLALMARHKIPFRLLIPTGWV